MAFIFYVSSMPEPPLPPHVSDKAAHSFGYTWLGLLVARAVSGGLWRRMTLRDIVLAIVIATLYGVSDEFHQSFVPGRDADIHDVYADASGAVIGTMLWWVCAIISRRFRDV
jgi:VanZ family protein